MKDSLKVSFLVLCVTLMTFGCSTKDKKFAIQFDNAYEVSGQKFALRDINPSLPSDWDAYNFVVLEYKISTPQRFQLGFTTADGYNEVRVMSYVPGQWNKLAIPLKYFTELPDPAVDIAATMNHARYTGWINLGGKRGPLHQVDSIGFRMRKAIGNPTLELRNVTLAVDDPGDEYLGDRPAVDEFGQSNLLEWEGKAHSLADLERDWRAEESDKSGAEAFNYSKFGGYLQAKSRATGYFRTEQRDGRWWFVDPEGYLFLSVGVDCVNIGSGLNVRDYDKRPNMYSVLPPDSIAELTGGRGRNGNRTNSFGMWNLYRRYGADFRQKAQDMTIRRMERWGLNTIANWSSREIMNLNRKAFLIPLPGLGLSGSLMGLSDIYDPENRAQIDRSIRQFVEPLKNNPWLIGYFIGNEPAWLDEEARLCGLILQGEDTPLKAELKKYLESHGDTDENRKTFIIETFDRFLSYTNQTLKKYDPHHLNLGIRFGNVLHMDERILQSCGRHFDVLSFNCYDVRPDNEMMDRVLNVCRLPMIIGEYHFGTIEHGMAQSLWQVESEEQRGEAYRYYTEQAYAHPGLIGTGYFQWADQDLTGRNDGENYHCGLVDVTDRPYQPQVEAMAETAKRLFEVHSGSLTPFDHYPLTARGYELIPDLWNE